MLLIGIAINVANVALIIVPNTRETQKPFADGDACQGRALRSLQRDGHEEGHRVVLLGAKLNAEIEHRIHACEMGCIALGPTQMQR